MTADQTAFLASPRTTGALLASGLAIGVLALVINIADGAPAPGRRSLQELAPHVFSFRITLVLWALAWISLLFGFVLLARTLVRAEDDLFAVLALVATVVAAVLAMLEASFEFTVTTWAAGEAADAGAVPTVYTALQRWVGAIQVIYIVLGLVGQAAFGASLLKTGLLPAWVGRTTLVWSMIWLVVLGLGIPAVLFIMPALIGVVLLLS